MIGRPDAAQLRRWQEEVARDPGSPAFLPLAELYRREGRLEVARRLCLRGLERSPEHVDAHVLLGRIHREAGDLDRAADEFDIALHLDSEHERARRALGYLCLERRDWPGAVRHLALAAAQAPADDRVASALTLARRHCASELPEDDGSAALADAVARFVTEARAQLALVTETSGRILLQHGFSRDLDLAALASLGAAVHSASGALARLLGERGFRRLHHGDGARQLVLASLAAADADVLLLAVFGRESSLGLLRVRLTELEREVARLSLRRGNPSASAFEAELAAGLRGAHDLPSPTPR